MTTVNSRVFSANPTHYLNLAIRERVAVKRGKMLFRIMPEPQFENISPSGDPYWADPRNVQTLKDYDRQRAEGKIKSHILTPEKQKEWFAEL
ncbi:MAG: hypothetical protein FWG79_07205 [Bacteroidales bacterium]|nr:hypothetical protein [Bacteroidales bacterium]